MNKRKSINCKNCGAVLSYHDSTCKYCNTKIIPEGKIANEDYNKLKNVAFAMEESLKSSKGLAMLQGFSFLLLSLLVVVSYFLLYHFSGSETKAIVFTVFIGFAMFLFFGFIIEKTDSIALKKKYKLDVKSRIDDYLKTMNFHRYEFDFVAEKELPKKAKLKQFLYKA